MLVVEGESGRERSMYEYASRSRFMPLALRRRGGVGIKKEKSSRLARSKEVMKGGEQYK